MAIDVTNNAVCLTSGLFCQTPTGVRFTGQAQATVFIESPHQAQGSVAGYTAGGKNPNPLATNAAETIDKYPFSSDTNASDVGDLTGKRCGGTGASSSVSGYHTAGGGGIEKFPFSSDTNATSVGSLVVGATYGSGHMSETHGYTSGGSTTPTIHGCIQKFPFASDTNAAGIGSLTRASQTYGTTGGMSSRTDGYTAGGFNFVPSPTNVIDKFPFASDTNASDVGDLTRGQYCASNQNSLICGYISGGQTPGGTGHPIQAFPFASGGNATGVMNLVANPNNYSIGGSGSSSGEFGYVGGIEGPVPTLGRLQKFPFANNADASVIGNITGGFRGLSVTAGGIQV